MNYNECKKRIIETFNKHEFKKNNKMYSKLDDDYLYGLSIQKSSYSKGIYINVSYFLLDIEKNVLDKKTDQGHIRTRFCFSNKNNEDVDLLQYENYNLNTETLEEELIKNIQELILTPQQIGMKQFLKINPILLLQANVKIKEYLKL